MRTYEIEQRRLAEHATAVVRATLDVSELGEFVGSAIAATARALASQDMSPAGPPFARYHRVGTERFEVEVGFPTTSALAPAGDVVASSLPGGPAAVMTYIGPYDEMEAAYGTLADWIVDRGGEPSGDPWEIYFSDPVQEPDPSQWCTEIVMPFQA